MIVAIHQPNYMPWLGYFAKLAQAELFVYLDDVQFSKNGYTNRVQVLNQGRRHWLTVPVRVNLGDAIDSIAPAKPDWARSHRDSLANFYRKAPAFRTVWPDIDALYGRAPDGDLATINVFFVEALAEFLGLARESVRSSAIETAGKTGDARLAAIVGHLAPGGTYLSGSGGKNYQKATSFEARGITLRYTRFEHPSYEQSGNDFESGLSVLDSVFRLGWDGTRDLILASIE